MAANNSSTYLSTMPSKFEDMTTYAVATTIPKNNNRLQVVHTTMAY